MFGETAMSWNKYVRSQMKNCVPAHAGPGVNLHWVLPAVTPHPAWGDGPTASSSPSPSLAWGFWHMEGAQHIPAQPGSKARAPGLCPLLQQQVGPSTQKGKGERAPYNSGLGAKGTSPKMSQSITSSWVQSWMGRSSGVYIVVHSLKHSRSSTLWVLFLEKQNTGL